MELPFHSTLFFYIHFIFLLYLTLQLVAGLRNSKNETDRHALIEFKANIDNDPYGFFSSWNDSINFCKWQGITCNLKHQRVMFLDLHGLSLSGTISPHIGNLSFLTFLNLQNNSFYGEIPQEIGNLFRLRHLNLSNNALGGEVPVYIRNCSELRMLGLTLNNLTGKIPDELGDLKKLALLRLGGNKFTGEIPRSFGNLSSLEYLSLSANQLVGNIPNELGRLTRLTFLAMGLNNLIGTIPPALFNISSLTLFSLPKNQLHGTLPASLGLNLPNLQLLQLDLNQFQGSIPVSLTNASQLQILDLSDNIFTGHVPRNLGYLNNVQQINLELNFLGTKTGQDLSFVNSLTNCSKLELLFFGANNLTGILPSSITNMSTTLQQLGIGENHISGRLPLEVGNLVNLYALGMEKNLLSGPIPISFGKLRNLQLLTLELNILSGEIPSSLGNLTQLYLLSLAKNKLEGNLPSSIGNCQNLNYLDFAQNNLTGSIPDQIFGLSFLSKLLNLSHNSFIGPLPENIGNLRQINVLDVSENKLSGEIPRTVGDCESIEMLNMQGNFFQGIIPTSIASLRGLKHLDLSRNNLSGNVPKDLEKLTFLQYLNLSFNNLDGEIPKKGVFKNASAFAVNHNKNLCGGNPKLRLPLCPIQQRKHRSPIVIILSAALGSIAFLMAITFFCLFCWRKSRKTQISTPSVMDSLPKVSYKELLQATGGFSSDNLIGQGSFGSVYRGNLDQQGERIVAVKVLNLQQRKASQSFIAECKVLRNVRHRNLVKVLTYCSSIDFRGNDFKALVFDFMVNGSLDTWLHPTENNGNGQSRSLNLLQRFKIAIDVASAVHYLHDDCEVPIIHCDLKPSNILLNDDMTAHVGDFGLARLWTEASNNSSQGEISSIGLKGTIGYMAPEYGVGNVATTSGDTYSVGIILLEMFTGKRPTDEAFTNGLNIHNFVKTKLPGAVLEVVDPILFAIGDIGKSKADGDQESKFSNQNFRAEGDNVQKCIESVLEIGVACSAELPEDRMNMRDAVRKLNVTKDAFLRARIPSPRDARTKR